MNIKSYSITVKQYFTNKNSYALKNYRLKNRSRSSDDNPEILFEIKYYDNSKKKIEDLKEYICDIANYRFCPCSLKICNKKGFECKNLLNLEFIEEDDSKLLSCINLKDSFCVFATDSKCECTYSYKKKYKNTKLDLLKNLIEKENKIANYNDQSLDLKKKDQKINNIEQELKQLKNEKNNYIEFKQIIQNKENEIQNLQKKVKENENTINSLIKENKKNEKERLEFEKKINNYENEITELKKKVSEINNKSNQKDNLFTKIKNENENNIKDLNLIKDELNSKKIELENLEKEKIENKKNIEQLNEKLNNLNSTVQSQKKEIEKLSKKENDEKIRLNNLENKLKENKEIAQKIEKERDNYKQNLENICSEKKKLEKNYQLKEENEKHLKEELNKIENNNFKEKDELNEKIKNLNKEKALLTMAINKDSGTLKQFHELGLLKDIKINNNDSIQIDPNTYQLVQNKNTKIDENIELKNFYDIIINIKSIKDISKGWEIKMTQKGEDNFKKYRNKELIVIGVIGNSNKGKSFFLSRISKIKFPSGTSIKTEGLSIKYPELEGFKNRKIVLLDSAGLETPVINEENKFDVENEDSDNEENIKNLEAAEEPIHNNQNIEINEDKKENENEENIEKNKGKEEEKTKDREIFKEKSREKLITELFLQNYIINSSDILILVVGILTYSEQKLINRIKTEIQKLKKNKPLYIIHNLKTFYTKKQVKDYIKNTLGKSITFDIKKGQKISTNIKDEDGVFYFEKNNNHKVFHLIFANEGSEAGDYYNNFTLNFIEKKYQDVTDFKSFDVIQSIKERFIELSTEIIEKTNENQKLFKYGDIISNEEIIKNKVIKLKAPQQITLKRCLIDELGFSNLKGNGFEPNFNYYKKGNNIIIRLEAPGNSSISSKLEYSGELTIINITGLKKKDKEPENNADNIHTTREFGEFSLDIPLKTEDFHLLNDDPKVYDKKGVIILEYKCDQKKDIFTYKGKEEDDI